MLSVNVIVNKHTRNIETASFVGETPLLQLPAHFYVYYDVYGKHFINREVTSNITVKFSDAVSNIGKGIQMSNTLRLKIWIFDLVGQRCFKSFLIQNILGLLDQKFEFFGKSQDPDFSFDLL